MLSLLLRYVRGVDHVNFLYFGGKLFLASIIGSSRFILVFAVILGFTLTLRRYLASLFKDPTIPIGVGCWFILGAVDLAHLVQDHVELPRSVFVPFKGLPFLHGSRSVEPYIYCGILGVAPAIFMPVFVFIAPPFAIGVASL